MRIAVIGCGLIGAAVARELQLRGARTVVYEERGPGEGTSGTTFAWVNSFDKEPRAYHELNVAGVHAHHELHARDAGGPQWFFPTGNLVWAEGHDELDRIARVSARLEAWEYPVQRLTRRVACVLEPDVRIPDHVEEVLFLPLEGHVLPSVLLARLLGEALDCGAELRCPARVEAVTVVPAGVRIDLGDGSTDVADAAVSCSGRWTEGLIASAGYPLPMVDPEAPGSASVGYLAYTRPAPVRINRVVTSPRLHLRPDGGGRLLLQALDLDVSADPAVAVGRDGPLAQELASRSSEVLRGVAGMRIDAIRVGQRSLPADGLTVAGFVGESSRLYVIATHSGVTLAPYLARLAADEIVGDTPAAILAPFRPQRFDGAER